MLLIKRGGAGYEAENTARLFFPALRLWNASTPPANEDFIAAAAGPQALLALLRLDGRVYWQAQPAPPAGADAEYALCRLLYALLCRVTGRRRRR